MSREMLAAFESLFTIRQCAYKWSSFGMIGNMSIQLALLFELHATLCAGKGSNSNCNCHQAKKETQNVKLKKYNLLKIDAIILMLIGNLPAEILENIFRILLQHHEILCSNVADDTTALVCCSKVSKLWRSLTAHLICRSTYKSRTVPFLANKILAHNFATDSPEWARICLLSLACFSRSEWGTGALRMFYLENITSLNDSLELRRLEKGNSDPTHESWNNCINCTLDIPDVYAELTRNSTNMHQQFDKEFVPLILRYSEKMDRGSFLIFLRLSSGPTLLRVRPTGLESLPSTSKLIIWDQEKYGTCNSCGLSLTRMQVCSQCKVSQYCSRGCQIDHWNFHLNECPNLIFTITDTIDKPEIPGEL